MKPWFTVDKIDHTTYAISEYQHWEMPHAYLVIGDTAAALIDTGLGVADISAVVRELTDLPIQVITTHVHWDHIGGHRHFSNIAVHESEAAFLEDWFPIPKEMVMFGLQGQACDFPDGFHPDLYEVFHGPIQCQLKQGDGIHLGNRTLRVIHTPGHSIGHICLYEAGRKYLYTGDLVYAGKLDAFYFSTSPQDFADSIERISTLPITKILPGHNTLEIDSSIILEIHEAFQGLKQQDKLFHGSGIYDYPRFKIHM